MSGLSYLDSVILGIVGFLAKDLVSGSLRSLWVVAGALILWSGAMWWAEREHSRRAAEGTVRDERDITIKDGVIIGLDSAKVCTIGHLRRPIARTFGEGANEAARTWTPGTGRFVSCTAGGGSHRTTAEGHAGGRPAEDISRGKLRTCAAARGRAMRPRR